jgi:flagellar biosynthesis protein FlhB
MGDDSNDDADADGDDPLPEPDPETVAFLRRVAEEVRAESSESEQLANILYRTSDVYDDAEETTPEDVVKNVKFILEVKERGGLGR